MNTEKLKEVFLATLDNPEKELRTALRINPIVSYLGEEFASEYKTKRNAVGIFLYSLRFSSEIPKETDSGYKESRYTDQEPPKHTMIMWNNNVVEITDELEIVEWDTNKDFYDSTVRWFNGVWREAEQ